LTRTSWLTDKTDAAKFLGHGQTKQAHILHVLNDVQWHVVVLFEVVFCRDQPLADEALQGRQQEVKGFGIEGHGEW
jgi:hypothetical protein